MLLLGEWVMGEREDWGAHAPLIGPRVLGALGEERSTLTLPAHAFLGRRRNVLLTGDPWPHRLWGG